MQVVAPKRAALADANKRLEGANKKLSGIRASVKELKVGIMPPAHGPCSALHWCQVVTASCTVVPQDRVATLEEALVAATEQKNAAVAAVGRRTLDHTSAPRMRAAPAAW